ncbi:MAG: helicase-related protein [Acidobacteriota bacterium]
MSDFNPFTPNQLIELLSNPGRRGITTGQVKRQGTRIYIQVEFGRNDRSYIDMEDLAPVKVGEDSVSDLVLSLKLGKKGDLARILTYHKISSRLSNVFYAMQTSRTSFYAYQFKSVYKFIESANGRILIADEVGLGKTIEAGLIWQEIKARSGGSKMLVICPSMLSPKWKEELRSRFSVQAEIYDANRFLSLLADFRTEGESFQCAAVCSLQGLRHTRIQEAIEEFAGTGLSFDLVVIDEAHYLRNVDTQTHRMAKAVSGIAGNLILLTATPIHLKSEDLFRLLNVLDPDEFSSPVLFDDRIRANEAVVIAQNALRRTPVDLDTARTAVSRLSQSPWFAQNPLTPLVTSKVFQLNGRNPAETVEAGRLLENLNLLSATVTRTRKREVQEWRVIRNAKVLNLEYGPQEMAFYNGVTAAVRNRARLAGDQGFEAFMLMMPQRQMASCIPAMVEYYQELIGRVDDLSLDEEILEEDLGISNGSADRGGARHSGLPPEVIDLIRGWGSVYPDSKYDALVGELKALFRQEPDVKILLFSYFKRTLAYLHRRLARDGFRTQVIHGDVDMEQRQRTIESFRHSPEFRLLLSSEVGAEGLDLQFCRVLINYDLPWNPMKVEQRIGRLDRLGQKSERISIVNLAARDTIEEKILNRLYQRIGIFERSIGDLEPILGDMIQKLTTDLLSRTMTPQEEESRIEQTRLAIEEKRRLETDLEDRSAVFFGSADFILEQIRDARKTGRWITPAELQSYISDFFQTHFVGTRIAWDTPDKGKVTVDLSNDARLKLSWFCRDPLIPRTRLAQEGRDSVVLAYTSEAAQENRDLEFISHFHGLVRWITRQYAEEENPFFPTAAVEVETDRMPAGDYVFCIELWRFESMQKELQIAYGMASVSDLHIVDGETAELAIQTILERGKNWPYAKDLVDSMKLESAWERCGQALEERRGAAFEIFNRKMTASAERRRAHLTNHLARRQQMTNDFVAKLERRIADATTERERAQLRGLVKGQLSQLDKLRMNVEDQIQEVDRMREGHLEIVELAGGVCRITHGQ